MCVLPPNVFPNAHLISGAHNAEEALNQEKEKCANLSERLEKSQEHTDSMAQNLEVLKRKEKEVNEKCREQVSIYLLTDIGL